MQEVVVRMRRVSEDLREIRKRLEQLRNDPDADDKIVDEVLQLDLVREFKSSIDEMRMFLWEYFQAAVTKCSNEPERALQEFRLKRATEMLRSLQDYMAFPATPEGIEVRSLFERIQELADLTVERHYAAKSPNGPSIS